ncbi:PRAME family member 18-like isoform X4 [Rattus norvegicus]|uniref:PRAME family member 18-like isoform X4 n=1 Tax=Rattus norvegicus TaxID=10116 RepID=UPI002FD7CF38
MSGHTPPTLEKLARQTLLRNEAMAISCLGELPTILFPALFKEAFEGRHINLIKEMVAAWPFPCLPVGALMKTPNGETMKALLDGVDMRLTRTFHPKRTKLQVLDLRNEHHNFWNIWTGAEDSSHSAENLEEKQVAKVPDDAFGDPLSYLLHNFTERLGFLLLLSEPLSLKTSGIDRSALIWFGCDAP